MTGQAQLQYWRDHQVSTSEQLRTIVARVNARRARIKQDIEKKRYP